MFVSCTEEEWDAVLRVHLKGHFCLAHHACEHWRDESKAGRQPNARIVNTSSGAGLQGSVGQSAYSAAKGGIAALTLVQAAELARYGVTSERDRAVGAHAHDRGPVRGAHEGAGRGLRRDAPRRTSRRSSSWLGSAESKRRDGSGVRDRGRRARRSRTAGARARSSTRARAGRTDEIGAAVHDLLRKAAPPQKVYGA